MPTASEAFSAVTDAGVTFWSGVPDSLLKPLCGYVADHAPERAHVTTANEGGAIAVAAGHYIATREPAAVYLQNSGLGNAVNPLVSLADPEVYGIPMLVIIGWRGQPGTPDEPQHRRQGEATPPLLDAIGVPHAIAPMDTGEFARTVSGLVERAVSERRPVALVVPKGVITDYTPPTHDTTAAMTREQAVATIAAALPADAVIVSTTGKTSRELFEHRVQLEQGHERDFLVVGSMGHASQIALGIALADPTRPVWILDGDGAAVMHLGGLCVIAHERPENLHHVVLNNGVHDSVGGQPTPIDTTDFTALATAIGYTGATQVENLADLDSAIRATIDLNGPTFVEAVVAPGGRADLGRPSTSPGQNLEALMDWLDG